MKQQIIGLTFGVAALLMATQHAFAQAPRHCGERANIVNRLAETYGETRRSMGLGTDNAVVEMFASADTGTWTITVTMANGVTCLVASGRAYEELNEQLQPAGAAL